MIPEGLYVEDREGEEAGLVVEVQEVRRFGDLHKSPVLRQLRAIREEVRLRFDLDQRQGRRVQSSDAQSGEDSRNVGSRQPRKESLVVAPDLYMADQDPSPSGEHEETGQEQNIVPSVDVYAIVG